MRRLTIPVCMSVFVALALSAEESHPWDLKARVQIDYREDNFKTTVFLQNPTDQDISFVCGRGGVSKTVVPEFTCAGMWVIPSKFRTPPRERMWPVSFVVPAGKEVVYDEYILAYPETRPGTHPLSLRFAFGTKSEQALDIAAQLKVPERKADQQPADRRAVGAPGLTLEAGESYDFVFEGLDYKGKKDILPQVTVYFGKGADQLKHGQHFTYQLFSNDFTDKPFSTGTDPVVSSTMVSSAYGNAWQDKQGAIRLKVTSGMITFSSLRITVYTGSEVYESIFHLVDTRHVDDDRK